MSRKSLYSVLLVAGFILLCSFPTLGAQASSTATLSLSNIDSYEISMHNHFSSWNWATSYAYGTDINRQESTYSVSANDTDGQTISRTILAFDLSSLGVGISISSAYVVFNTTGSSADTSFYIEDYDPANAISELNLYNEDWFGGELANVFNADGSHNVTLNASNLNVHGGMLYLGFRMQSDYVSSTSNGLDNCTIIDLEDISISVTYTGGGTIQETSTTITGIIQTIIFFLPGFFLNLVVKRWGMIIGITIMTLVYFTTYTSFIWVMPIGLTACALMFFSEAD